MPMTHIWWLLRQPQVLKLQKQSPWRVTLTRLVSGVTFGWWNSMLVRLRLWLQVTHIASLVTSFNYCRNCAERVGYPWIFGVRFDSKITFEKHLRFVSRWASEIHGIFWKSWQVFHDRLLLGRCFQGFVLPVVEYCSAVLCLTADTHLKQ